jgi:hypothetical protein
MFRKNSVIELKLPRRGDYECVNVCVWARATAHNFLLAGVKTNTDNFLSSVLLTSYSQACETNDKH